MTGQGPHIRDATAADAQRMAQIYEPYVRGTVISFETDVVPAGSMSERLAKVKAAGLPWLVIEDDAGVAGFAYAAPFRERAAYAHSVETTIYLAEEARGGGLGTALYGALLDKLQALDVHTAVSLIALPNAPSVALHERLGFTHAGTLAQVGRKFDRWIDVGYWQLNVGEGE